jgi:hypothetical protein
MRLAGLVARTKEKRKLYKVGKPEGKRSLGWTRSRLENWIKMELRKTGWEGEDWIHLAQDRDWWRVLVSAVMNLRVLEPRS